MPACIWVDFGGNPGSRPASGLAGRWDASLVDRPPGTGTSEFTVKGVCDGYIVLLAIVDGAIVYVKRGFLKLGLQRSVRSTRRGLGGRDQTDRWLGTGEFQVGDGLRRGKGFTLRVVNINC